LQSQTETEAPGWPASDNHIAPQATPWTLYQPAERRRMLFVLFLVGTLTFIDRNIVSILVEPLKQEFALSDTQVGLLTGIAFALFYALLGLPISNYADHSDRKRLTIIALSIWSLFTAVTGTAQSFWHLVLCRMGVGAAESASLPAAQSLIADYFPPGERGKALAGYSMSTAAAYVIALAGGGWIAQHYGWRAALIGFGLLGYPVALLCYLVLKEPRRKLGHSFKAEPLSAGLGKLLAKPAYCYLLSGMVVYFSLAQGAFVFMPSYLIRSFDLTMAEVGLLYSIVATCASIGGTIIGGFVTDWLSRKDPAWAARIPAIAMLVCIPLFELAMLSNTLVLTLIILAMGLALVASMLPSMFAAIHAVCGNARRALAIALALAAGNLLGQSLGPVLTGALSDALAVGADSALGLRRALMIVFVLFLPGGLLLLCAARHLARDCEN